MRLVENRLVAIGVVCLMALFAAVGLNLNTSRAAFSASTSNTSNVFTASACFGSQCVEVLDGWTTGTVHAVSAGSDRLLLVGVYGEDSGVINSVATVTWGGQTLTEIDEVVVGTGYSNLAWVGYLDETGIAGATGSTIVATWSGTTPNESVLYTAVTLENVDQTTPIGGSSTGTALNTSTVQPAGALNVDTDDLAVYVTVSGAQGETHTPASGYVEGTEQDSGGVGQVAANATKPITVTGTEQPIANWINTNNRLAIISTVINVVGTTPPTAALSGTVVPSATETETKTGGETLIITLTADTWDPTIGADNAKTTALINGIDSGQSETDGWDAVVKTNMDFNDVTRTSNTTVTITLGAEPTYNITTDETITVTVPATALTNANPITATPTFTITALEQSEAPLPVVAGDEWKYFVGTSQPALGWNDNAGFDDSAWLSGPSGFGYGDSDDATVLTAGFSTLYVRKVFNVTDPSAVTGLKLTVDYDDAFVAYLNGVEVARSNFTGAPVYNSLADGNHEASGGNSSPQPPDIIFFDNSLLEAGDNVIALIGLNVSTASSDFTLIPTLEQS